MVGGLTRSAVVVAVMAGLVSCSGGDSSTSPPPDTTPAAISVVSGDAQSGETGSPLGQQLVVRVANAGGNSLLGVTVAWAVEGGGGDLASSTSTTNSQGQASNAYTLGDSEGTNTVRASVQGTALSATFTATAVAPEEPDTVATAIEIVKGNNQSAVVGEALDSVLLVVVRNAAGDSLPAKLTSWAVTAGGGQLPFGDEVLTNGAGEAGNFYVVGPNPGANTVEVTVTGNPTVKTSFSATATAPPATASVNVTDNQFVPDEVQIATGGKVTWTWAGSNDHNVIWVSGGFADSGTQSSGSHEVIFGASGSYDYYCSIHGSPSSGMRGKVEVKD